MERKELIRLLSLNLGIAAADIIAFSPKLIGLVLFGPDRFETALGVTIIFLSGVGLTYGNYMIIKPDTEIPAPPEDPWTVERYIKELNNIRRLKTFEKDIDLLLSQIERLKKKTKTIRDNLLQKFSATEMTYKRLDADISKVEETFFMNIRSIISRLDAFDEEDYKSLRERYEAGAISKQTMEEKFKVYEGFITFVRAATEYNEQILLMLDKLLVEIIRLNSIEPGQLDQMPGIREIEEWRHLIDRFKN